MIIIPLNKSSVNPIARAFTSEKITSVRTLIGTEVQIEKIN